MSPIVTRMVVQCVLLFSLTGISSTCLAYSAKLSTGYMLNSDSSQPDCGQERRIFCLILQCKALANLLCDTFPIRINRPSTIICWCCKVPELSTNFVITAKSSALQRCCGVDDAAAYATFRHFTKGFKRTDQWHFFGFNLVAGNCTVAYWVSYQFIG